MVQHIQTSIEINVTPAMVRAKFLDWASVPNYSPTGLIKKIEQKNPSKPLQRGTLLHIELDGMKLDPTVDENSPSRFAWTGSLPLGTFVGTHYFRFEAGEGGPQTTTLVHGEDFSGVLSFIMGSNFAARSIGLLEKTSRGFEQFNQDLKKECEK